MKAVGAALEAAGLTKEQSGVLAVIRRAVASASVTAQTCTPGTTRAHAVTLKGTESGELKKIAVPVSSNFEEWYTKPSMESVIWAIDPVVRIDRRRVTLVLDEPSYSIKKMTERANRRKQYFVHNYSMSNTSYDQM